MMSRQGLEALAAECGVLTNYHDGIGHYRVARSDAMLQVLSILGVDIEHEDQAWHVLERTRHKRLQSVVSEVIVAWTDAHNAFEVTTWGGDTSTVQVEIDYEQGGGQSFAVNLRKAEMVKEEWAMGEHFVTRRVWFTQAIPVGYHTLRVQIGDHQSESLLVCAPERAYELDTKVQGRKAWGSFLPLYSARTSDEPIATYTDLGRYASFTGQQGGRLFGTLPLLATFLTEPFEPSPYSPASRLFWNELYIDPSRTAEILASPEAREILGSDEYRRAAIEEALQDGIDYEVVHRMKRAVLLPLSKVFFDLEKHTTPTFKRFLEAYPRVEAYAAFRAATEKASASWPHWEERAKAGRLLESDYDQDEYRYHLYIQYTAHHQIKRAVAAGKSNGCGLYLDLPIGSHYASYDVWANKALFALGVSAGAPPDPLFAGGQSWGFPPPHPHAMRRDRYRFFIETLRLHMRHADALRVDHVLGLNRMYWVADGHDAKDGIYVKYPLHELVAILCVESHRSACAVIGEDLGTVPDEIVHIMHQRGLLGMHVTELELQGPPHEPVRPMNHHVVASINTHDMPTFMGWWEHHDIEDQKSLGLLDELSGLAVHQTRERKRHELLEWLRHNGHLHGDTPGDILKALLRMQAVGPAPLMLLALEDLWLETLPQNTPGTWRERPNWRRRAQHDLRMLDSSEALSELFANLNQWRR